MAQIPRGNFTQATVQAPVRHSNVDVQGNMAIGRAAEQLGQQGMQVADQAMREQIQQRAQDKQEDEQLAQAKAANALLDDEIGTRAITDDVQERINSGDLDWRKADEEYQTQVNKLAPVEIPGLNPVMQEHLQGGLKRNRQGGKLAVDGVMKGARREEFKGQFYQSLDSLGKIAGQPGSDIEKINTQADAFIPLAKAAGIDEATIQGRVQQFKDNNWMNQAKLRMMQSQTNPAALEVLSHDLTAEDGYYASKLDPDKRNAILGSVITAQTRLEAKTTHDADKREAAGQRALDKYDTQIMSGVPAPMDFLTNVADAVKGTTHEGEFKERVAQEIEVRQVMNKPPLEQQAYIQQLQAAQQKNGATVQEQANLRRLQTAVETNQKMLKDSPLQFNANRTGEAVKPLDMPALQTGDTAKVSEQFADRMVTLKAMRKQYGAQTGNSPLLPQEASMIGAAVTMLPPKGALQFFGALSTVINDPDAYNAAIQQISPDSPVRALAGRIYARQGSNGGAVVAGTPGAQAGNVAMMLMRGESILNPGKAASSEDGKGGKIKMPPPTDMDVSIADAVGEGFMGRPEDMKTATQGVRAYYAAASADAGDYSGEIDSERLQTAIKAVIGETADVGGREVLPPWGVSKDTFEDQADTYIDARFKAAGIERPRGVQLLATRREGYYALTRGLQPLTDKNGQVLVIKMGGVQ